MGSSTKFLLSCLLIMLAVSLTVNAAVVFGPGGTTLVLEVGGADGWSPKSHFDYNGRSSKPFFLVGDGVRFIYDPSITNVLEVTSPDYQSCDPTSPLATYNSGNDTILLTKVDHRYFISDNPVDCNNGMKFEVDVGNSSWIRRVRACPGCNNTELKHRPPCCDKNTSTEGTSMPPTSTGTTAPAPIMSPGSTPTMSPNSTSYGAISPNTTTSAASKFFGNRFYVIVASLQFLALCFFH